MDVKIGVVYTAKELIIDVDGSAEDVAKAVETAMGNGSGMLWLADSKGRRVGIPTEKLAYVEFGGEEGRKVGFSKQ